MKPRPFDYVRPETVEEVLALLAQYGDDARILAGGQSLIPMLNLRLADPKVLIDISRLAELDVIRNISEAGEVGAAAESSRTDEVSSRGGFQVIQNPHPHEKVEIGAAVTQNKLLAWPHLKAKVPLLAAALPFVGHFQTRNKGTVCGSIAHADPSAELPLALKMLDGEVVLRSRGGSRVLRAADFHKGMLTTAREPDELITAVRFCVTVGQGAAFREITRRHGDFAIIAVAALATGTWVRIGVGGLAEQPVYSAFRSDHSSGDMPDGFGKWVDQLEGYDDLHASAAMRRDIFKKLAPLVIEEARRCAA
jgi:2-furoyl-CoA dehydrogenase FAD binding subunit